MVRFKQGARGPGKLVVRIMGRWFELREVFGPSMEPTLREGDRVLARILRGRRRPKAGDIVFAESPDGMDVVKRVAAVPGQPVEGIGPLPEGHYWLVGDNGRASRDSRGFGPVPLASIRSVALMALSPSGETRTLV